MTTVDGRAAGALLLAALLGLTTRVQASAQSVALTLSGGSTRLPMSTTTSEKPATAFVLTHDIRMPTPYWAWAKESVGSPGSSPLLDGTIEVVDSHGAVMYGTAFVGGRLTRIVFPALDAASSNPAMVRATITISGVRQVGAGGWVTLPPAGSTSWPLSYFRLAIDGLSPHVLAVDSIAVDVAYQRISGLAITIPATDAGAFSEWLTSLQQGTGRPKAGYIAYVAPSSTSAVLTLSLAGLVPTHIEHLPTSTDGTQLAKVTMSIGRLQLQ